MGKIRIKTIGDEELEQQQQAEAKARKEAKKARLDETEESEQAEKKADASAMDTEELKTKEGAADAVAESENQGKKVKKEKFQKVTTHGPSRSKSYQAKAALVDKNKVYTLDAALKLLPELKRAKFDETVEIHLTTTETGISGSVTLPHGTGKQTRVAIARGSDQNDIDNILKKIESGNIDFDILIATPDAMPRLARVARVLGPRGLMPNPKNGTVTPNPDDAAKKYAGGHINFKTEAKFPLLHIAVGKVSFEESKLKDNVKSVMSALDKKKIKNATVKSTMSPAIRLDLASL